MYTLLLSHRRVLTSSRIQGVKRVGEEGGHFSSCSIWIYQPSQSPRTSVGRGGYQSGCEFPSLGINSFPKNMTTEKIRQESPDGREYKTVLDSGFHLVDFGFRIPIVNGSCIPDSKAWDSGFHEQNVNKFLNSHSLTWGGRREGLTSLELTEISKT